MPGVPIILLGTKSDLRNDPTYIAKLSEEGSAFVTPEDSAEVAGGP